VLFEHVISNDVITQATVTAANRPTVRPAVLQVRLLVALYKVRTASVIAAGEIVTSFEKIDCFQTREIFISSSQTGCFSCTSWYVRNVRVGLSKFSLSAALITARV